MIHHPSMPNPADFLRGSAKAQRDYAADLDSRAEQCEQQGKSLRAQADAARATAAEYDAAAKKLAPGADLPKKADWK